LKETKKERKNGRKRGKGRNELKPLLQQENRGVESELNGVIGYRAGD